MDFELTDDQVALQEGVRSLLAGRFPMETIRGWESTGLDRTAWKELADTGVFNLRVPEADGGVGLGMADAVLVFEELGRACVPGPLVATHLASELGFDGVVGGIDRHDAPLLVEHLDALDTLLVLDDEGVWKVDPRSLDAAPVRPTDPLTPMHKVASLPRGEQVGGADVAARWRIEGGVLTSALMLGLAEGTLDRGVAYAKERKQFDKPIGAFQAIKHLLADMLVRVEVTRAAVYAAGVTVDDPEIGDPARAAASAKVLASDAALLNAKSCIQVHGGMGFTWEVDAHLFLKRAWVHDTHFGTPDAHTEALAELV